MIYMDDDSHEQLGQRKNQAWDRSLHARLVDRLTDAGAKLVVFDIVFDDADPFPERDRAFADAVGRHGGIILAADRVPAGYGRESIVDMWTTRTPIELLRRALRYPDRDVGSAGVRPSADFAIREHFHGARDDLLASLSWTAAWRAGVRFTTNDTERLRERWVNYYGPPGTLPNLSYHLALDTNAAPQSIFEGKVVFVGPRLLTLFAGERKDEFRNPYSYWYPDKRFIPGVEVHATVFLNLLRGDWLSRWPRGIETLVLAALGAGFGFGLLRMRPWKASGIAVLGVASMMVASWLLFTYQWTWFPWLIAVVQIFAALLYAVVFNSFQLYLQKRLYEHTVALYLSPKLVRKFSKDQRFMEEFLKPTASKQRLTFLFSDIANFTSISEGMDSDDLAQAMNAYFEKAITLCIHPTDGTVVKYIGDAIYALWNAPDLQSDHALRACRAALCFRDQGVHYMNGQPLVTRIGLHTGIANVGNFGSVARFDYTALGENVNLASRMEGLNKYLGTSLLATGDTYGEVAGQIASRFCGRFRLKGFEKAVEAHELIGYHEHVSDSRAWRECFASALECFQRRQFDKAKAGFNQTLALKPDDGPSQFYLAEIAELRLHPPPDGWAGEVELKEK